eukprot:6594696-Pyramimonas_sp.AAC.1
MLPTPGASSGVGSRLEHSSRPTSPGDGRSTSAVPPRSRHGVPWEVRAPGKEGACQRGTRRPDT